MSVSILHKGKTNLDMGNQERRAAYASLWVLALAFGWIEASVVVYLREIYVREVSLGATSALPGLQVSLVSLPGDLVVLEMAREACTILLLGAVAWLGGRRPADRVGAFLLAFGVWDLTYYGGLKLVLDWPASLSAWDILFLIPLPWVAPVWAPVTVATLFVGAGSYLFWTSKRQRLYRWPDIAVLVVSVLLTIAAFLAESRAAVDHRVPEQFPVWLFWAGVVLGTAWFLRVERRVQTALPEHSRATAHERGVTIVEGAEHQEADIGRVIWEYTEARRRLDALVSEAGELGERFERLAHGLSAHPRRLLIGVPDRFVPDPNEWDVVPGHALPRIETLAKLTDEIREATRKVDELRERLILMGRADLVQQPDEFFR